MKLALIVAAARNHAIGRDNQLPWHLPQDLKYFKSVTLGKPIIMGRKTFESIGRPLPGRTNVVVTRQLDWLAEGVQVAHTLKAAIALADGLPCDELTGGELMVIGGAEIYRHALPLADRIYLTRVNVDVDGDAFFPELNEAQWHKISAVSGEATAPFDYEFQVWERVDQ